jgi:hypothetical protein
MSTLDYLMEPTVTCPDTDANDAAFIRAASMIKGRDGMEEFLACDMHLLSADFVFREIANGKTLMSKVVVPLPDFQVVMTEGESDSQFLAKVDLQVDNINGSYGPRELDACILSLPNGGHLN